MSIKTIFFGALFLLFLYGFFTVGFPFLLAFLLAFMLEPFIRTLSKRSGIKRTYWAVIVCTVFTIILCGLTYLLITKVIHEAAELIKSLLEFTTKDSFANMDWLSNQYLGFLHDIPSDNVTLQQVTQGLLGSFQSLLGQAASLFFDLAKAIPSLFLQAIIFFLAFYLISMNLPKIKKSFLHCFDPSVHSKVKLVLIKLHKAIFGFLRAQCIISFFIFFVVFIGFLIMGIRYPSALAFLITVVDILPILGTGSVMVPMAFFYLLIGNTFLFWGLLIHYAIITIVRKVIEPKILSESIGISALSTLASMYIGFRLVGAIGLFLGPFVIILYQAMVKAGLINLKIKF